MVIRRTVYAHCSWCGVHAVHTLTEPRALYRSKYRCLHCRAATLPCANSPLGRVGGASKGEREREAAAVCHAMVCSSFTWFTSRLQQCSDGLNMEELLRCHVQRSDTSIASTRFTSAIRRSPDGDYEARPRRLRCTAEAIMIRTYVNRK